VYLHFLINKILFTHLFSLWKFLLPIFQNLFVLTVAWFQTLNIRILGLAHSSLLSNYFYGGIRALPLKNFVALLFWSLLDYVSPFSWREGGEGGGGSGWVNWPFKTFVQIQVLSQYTENKLIYLVMNIFNFYTVYVLKRLYQSSNSWNYADWFASYTYTDFKRILCKTESVTSNFLSKW